MSCNVWYVSVFTGQLTTDKTKEPSGTVTYPYHTHICRLPFLGANFPYQVMRFSRVTISTELKSDMCVFVCVCVCAYCV